MEKGKLQQPDKPSKHLAKVGRKTPFNRKTFLPGYWAKNPCNQIEDLECKCWQTKRWSNYGLITEAWVNQASLLLHPDQEDSIIKALFHQWTRIISGDLTNTADLSWVHSTVRWPYLWWAPQASAAPSSTGGRTQWCRASLCPKTSLLPAGDPGTKTPSCCRGYKKKTTHTKTRVNNRRKNKTESFFFCANVHILPTHASPFFRKLMMLQVFTSSWLHKHRDKSFST